MFETYASEADLCEALGPAYPSSGVFDETVRDRQPREVRWCEGPLATPSDTDVWEMTFRVLSTGGEGHVVARLLTPAGDRTGAAIPMTGQLSETSSSRLRERLTDRHQRGGVSVTAIPGHEIAQLRSWMHSTLTREITPCRGEERQTRGTRRTAIS